MSLARVALHLATHASKKKRNHLQARSRVLGLIQQALNAPITERPLLLQQAETRLLSIPEKESADEITKMKLVKDMFSLQSTLGQLQQNIPALTSEQLADDDKQMLAASVTAQQTTLKSLMNTISNQLVQCDTHSLNTTLTSLIEQTRLLKDSVYLIQAGMLAAAKLNFEYITTTAQNAMEADQAHLERQMLDAQTEFAGVFKRCQPRSSDNDSESDEEESNADELDSSSRSSPGR